MRAKNISSFDILLYLKGEDSCFTDRAQTLLQLCTNPRVQVSLASPQAHPHSPWVHARRIAGKALKAKGFAPYILHLKKEVLRRFRIRIEMKNDRWVINIRDVSRIEEMTEAKFHELCSNPPYGPPRKAREGWYWAWCGNWNMGAPMFEWREAMYGKEDEDE